MTYHWFISYINIWIWFIYEKICICSRR